MSSLAQEIQDAIDDLDQATMTIKLATSMKEREEK
jgi:hypothetical protein